MEAQNAVMPLKHSHIGADREGWTRAIYRQAIQSMGGNTADPSGRKGGSRFRRQLHGNQKGRESALWLVSSECPLHGRCCV